MALVSDIPERDTLDGAAQLLRLRLAIKDNETPYTYPDATLADLLVANDRVVSWRLLTGAGEDYQPFTYSLELLSEPLNRVRLAIPDIDESTLKYTDKEILDLLCIFPLKYAIVIYSALESVGSSQPSDQWNPIAILRKYLDDPVGASYSDKQLAELLVQSKLNPYLYAASLVTQGSGLASASSGGNNLASLDGISFQTDSESTDGTNQTVDRILQQYQISPYAQKPLYSVMVGGTELVTSSWEAKWYGL